MSRSDRLRRLSLRLTKHLVAILGPAMLAASEPPVIGPPSRVRPSRARVEELFELGVVLGEVHELVHQQIAKRTTTSSRPGCVGIGEVIKDAMRLRAHRGEVVEELLARRGMVREDMARHLPRVERRRRGGRSDTAIEVDVERAQGVHDDVPKRGLQLESSSSGRSAPIPRTIGHTCRSAR